VKTSVGGGGCDGWGRSSCSIGAGSATKAVIHLVGTQSRAEDDRRTEREEQVCKGTCATPKASVDLIECLRESGRSRPPNYSLIASTHRDLCVGVRHNHMTCLLSAEPKHVRPPTFGAFLLVFRRLDKSARTVQCDTHTIALGKSGRGADDVDKPEVTHVPSAELRLFTLAR
jgi:hypothetical protein